MTSGVLVERSRARTQSCSSASWRWRRLRARRPRRPPRPTRRRARRPRAASATAGWSSSTSSISPGRHVLAAAHDDVVEPALDEEEPAVVEPAAVVGREPAVVEQRRCGRGTRRTPARPARRSRPARPAATGSPVGVADLHLERRAAAGRPSRAAARTSGSSLRERVAVVVGPEHGDRRAGLGEAVGVDEVHVRQQRHRPLDDRRRGIAPAAVGQVAQRGRPLAARPR